jgi:foldase protein PrsA
MKPMNGRKPSLRPSRPDVVRGFGRVVLTLLCAVPGGVGAVALVGCGDSPDEGLPDGAVAKVGDRVITRSDFEEALKFAVGRGHDPRDYAACVASKKQQLTDEIGGTQPADAQLEEQCRAEYEEIKSNVIDYLIKAEWTRQETEARDIVVTDTELGQAVDQAEEGFLDAEALAKAGVTERELIVRIRQNLLQSKVTKELTEEAREVSAQDIADYYGRNTKQLVVPDRRDLRIVITRSRAKAAAARAALDAGRSWNSVAMEYSLHISRNEGGRVTDATRSGNRKDGLGAAIFGARTGEIIGPVKDDETWAVFVVDRIKPSYQPTLEQARDEIAGRLQSTREKQALEAYERKYRDRTDCAPGFIIPACRNGPRPTEDQPSA